MSSPKKSRDDTTIRYPPDPPGERYPTRTTSPSLQLVVGRRWGDLPALSIRCPAQNRGLRPRRTVKRPASTETGLEMNGVPKPSAPTTAPTLPNPAQSLQLSLGVPAEVKSESPLVLRVPGFGGGVAARS